MTLIFCDFDGGALLFDDDDDDGGASMASGLSFVELSFDVDDDDDVKFVTTAICCEGLKQQNTNLKCNKNFTIFLILFLSLTLFERSSTRCACKPTLATQCDSPTAQP